MSVEVIYGIRLSCTMENDLRHEPEHERFVLSIPGTTAKALLKYSKESTPAGIVYNVTHTEVPAELRGKGIGSALMRAVVAYSRTNKVKLIATCSYVAHYFSKNPSEADVLVSSTGNNSTSQT